MKNIKTMLKYIILIIITAVVLFPVVYMLACSFMSNSQVSNMLDFTSQEYKGLSIIIKA